jgi:sirohydrochlorin cobaltochelatase
MPPAVILFGHGSRDPAWRAPIEAVAARIRGVEPGRLVACAYLELDQPDLPTAARLLVSAGASAVRVVPMFLGTGRHAREDLPRLMDALRAAHPGVTFELAPAIGEHAAVLDLLAKIALA